MIHDKQNTSVDHDTDNQLSEEQLLMELYQSDFLVNKPGVVEWLTDWSADVKEVEAIIAFLKGLPLETKNWVTPVQYYLNELRIDVHKKSLEKTPGIENTRGELFNRNSSYLGEKAPRTAPKPVVEIPQPTFPANVHLHFTTESGEKSSKTFKKNLRILNLYANTMRDSAQWYLSEMAGTTMSYFYKNHHEESSLQVLQIRFEKRHWMHLTGVTPEYEQWVESLSEQFIDDVAAGIGHFKDLKFSLGSTDKLKVLNLLPEIIESDTFIFNDISFVQKFNKLNLSQALNPDDTDLLLLFREEGFHNVPASLMRIKGSMENQLANIDKGVVLGVYREKDGNLTQLSINSDYIKDGGEEMMAIMQNNLLTGEMADRVDSFNRDSDLDGLSDSLEYALGTNPFSADTDGDGIGDSAEVWGGTNPKVDDRKQDLQAAIEQARMEANSDGNLIHRKEELKQKEI